MNFIDLADIVRLHMAGNSIGIIRAFYRLGVRYVSINSHVRSRFC